MKRTNDAKKHGAVDPVEPTASNVNDVDYLDREGALAILGVKKESLYTYASRGLIRTVTEPGKRTRLYRKTDVEKLRTRAGAKSGAQRVASSLRYGEPVVQTWVCEITDAGPRYRGHLATTLASEGRSLEFVSELVWGGMPPLRDLPWSDIEPKSTVDLRSFSRKQRSGFSPLAALAHIAVELASVETVGGVSPHVDARTAGVCVLNAFAGVSGNLGARGVYQPQGENEYIAERLLKGYGLTRRPEQEKLLRLLNTALVLSVDNELSTPTFCARISASTGADLYSCVVAAIMAQGGPMQIGGASYLEAYLQAVLQSPRDVRHNGQDIPCFDHPLYNKDPRAALIIESIASLRTTSSVRTRLLRFVDRIYEDSGRYPNLFAALVILSMSLELPSGSAAFLHTLGRSAGWIAHAAEQRLSGTMLRPRARYMGGIV